MGVHIFVLITGYFTIAQKLNPKKLFLLWKIVFFYSVFSFVFVVALGPIFASTEIPGFAAYYFHNIFEILSNFIIMFFPILTGKFWFMTMYFLLILISPIVNEFLKKLEKRQFLRLLIISSTIYYSSCFVSIFYFGNGVFHFDNFGFIGPYLLTYAFGAFIRLYPPKNVLKTGFLVFIIGEVLLQLYILGMYSGVSHFREHYIAIRTDGSLVAFLIGFGIFLIISSIKFKNSQIGSFINKISSNVLEVYLINALLIDLFHLLFPKIYLMILHPDSSEKFFVIVLVLFSSAVIMIVALIFAHLRKNVSKWFGGLR